MKAWDWVKEKFYGFLWGKAVKKGAQKATAAAAAQIGAFFAYVQPYLEKTGGVDVDLTDGTVVITITSASLIAGLLEMARNFVKNRWPEKFGFL